MEEKNLRAARKSVPDGPRCLDHKAIHLRPDAVARIGFKASLFFGVKSVHRLYQADARDLIQVFVVGSMLHVGMRPSVQVVIKRLDDMLAGRLVAGLPTCDQVAFFLTGERLGHLRAPRP